LQLASRLTAAGASARGRRLAADIGYTCENFYFSNLKVMQLEEGKDENDGYAQFRWGAAWLAGGGAGGKAWLWRPVPGAGGSEMPCAAPPHPHESGAHAARRSRQRAALARPPAGPPGTPCRIWLRSRLT
jgi:hypothetical protein